MTAAVVTGSFGRVEVTSISGDGSNLTGTALGGTISSSGQINFSNKWSVYKWIYCRW